jgi:hypothetical protein
MKRIFGITPCAAKWATRQADKYAGLPHTSGFALNAMKNFGDLQSLRSGHQFCSRYANIQELYLMHSIEGSKNKTIAVWMNDTEFKELYSHRLGCIKHLGSKACSKSPVQQGRSRFGARSVPGGT